MTDKDDSFPLWQKILYGVLIAIALILIIWGADKVGLLEFFAGVPAM